MIRRTLGVTKAATYSIDLPEPAPDDMPYPTGTGFVVSADGWFVAAAHVITTNGRPDGSVRTDIGDGWLIKESRIGEPPIMVHGLTVDYVDPSTDFALLKLDFAANRQKAFLKGLSGFPFVSISSRQLEEGEDVYAFGYPLGSARLHASPPLITIGELQADTPIVTRGESNHCPRTTSAIVSSTLEKTKMVTSGNDPEVYTIDKALNYGNSGGPIVATATGHVHALCSRFQPVDIRQDDDVAPGVPLVIIIPSLYGIVSSMHNPPILTALRDRGAMYRMAKL